MEQRLSDRTDSCRGNVAAFSGQPRNAVKQAAGQDLLSVFGGGHHLGGRRWVAAAGWSAGDGAGLNGLSGIPQTDRSGLMGGSSQSAHRGNSIC